MSEYRDSVSFLEGVVEVFARVQLSVPVLAMSQRL